MSNIKNLLPLQTVNGNLVAESGEIAQVKYLPGYPRQYRFDARTGIFNIKGETPLTKKGEELTILPVAFRIFEDDILGEQYGFMKWAEFFFLNESKQVCALLVHGYSVENLMRMFDEMFYDGASFCDIRLTIKPEEKTNKKLNAKYWMANFSYKLLTEEEKGKLETATKDIAFWREDTLTQKAIVSLAMNFQPPTKPVDLPDAAKEFIEENEPKTATAAA